jgi:sulfite reductase (NADPH) flavoprotein alpha-component
MFKVMGVEQPKRNEPNQDRKKPEKEKLKPEQVTNILSQSWTGVNAQIGREYSSLTFNIPKKNDAKLELSFVDAIPQHERARNQAIYNYQSNTFEKFELYEDKKLNEKIMSSMLPVHRGSFFGDTYQFLAMLASLTMPLFFVTGWMLYLKRRKQKNSHSRYEIRSVLKLLTQMQNHGSSLTQVKQVWLSNSHGVQQQAYKKHSKQQLLNLFNS